jgi:hypothetical protein
MLDKASPLVVILDAAHLSIETADCALGLMDDRVGVIDCPPDPIPD